MRSTLMDSRNIKDNRNMKDSSKMKDIKPKKTAKTEEKKGPTRNVDKTIMDNFYKLVHPTENVRLTAARSTYKILRAGNKKSDSSNESLNYCVERLVSGLASSRENARNGYGVLLLEILETMQVSFERLYTVAEQKFGNINRDLHKDHIVGWYLLVNIILKSGIVQNKKKNQDKYTERLYKTLQQLKKVKNYMEIPICNTLQEYLPLFVDYLPDDLPRSVLASDSKLSTYSMFLSLIYHKHKPIADLSSLDKSEFPLLTGVIIDAITYKPHSHPVVCLINELILKDRNELFEDFFTNVVQPAYFVKDHSDMAALGFKLINQLIRSEYSNGSNIRTLLNDYITKACIWHAKDKSSRLYSTTHGFLQNLVDYFKEFSSKSDDLIFSKQHAILDCLTESPGSINFDMDSKTSTLEGILMHSPKEVLKKYMLKLQNSLLEVASTDKTEHRIKPTCLSQLALIIKTPQFSEETATIKQLSHFLLLHSFFKVNEGASKLKMKHLDATDPLQTKPTSPFDDLVRQSFRQTLYIAIDHIISSGTPAERYQRINDLIQYANSLIRTGSDNIEFVCPKEEQLEDVIKRWKKYVRKSKSFTELLEQGKNLRELYSILVLYHFYGLQILEHGINVSNELNDLVECLTKAANGDTTEPIWADVITDLLIGILSSTEFKPVFRKIAETVFSNMIPHLTSSSIETISLAITDTQACPEDEDSDGPMPSEDEDDESEEDDMGVDGENSSKSKTTKENTMSNGKLEKTDQTNEEFEASGGDSQEDQEDYMDDEQMMKFDGALSEMFKLKRLEKSSNDEQSRHQLSLRLRCLDLARKLMTKKNVNPNLVDNLVKCLAPLARSSKKNAANRPLADKVLLMLKKSPYRNKNPRIKALLASKAKKSKKSKDKLKKKQQNKADNTSRRHPGGPEIEKS